MVDGKETWTTLSRCKSPACTKALHCCCLTLVSLVTGSGRSPGPDVRDQESMEIFAPPYLFKGPRPTITTAPSVLSYNQAFNVATPDAANIALVALKGGSAT